MAEIEEEVLQIVVVSSHSSVFCSLSALGNSLNTGIRNFQTKYPTIQPFCVESPVSPSAMSRKTMGMDVKSPLPENRSPVSTDVQSRMVNTAITLAAEVQRLRGENDRLRQSGQMAHEAEVPPSYQQSDTHVEVDSGDSLDGFNTPV